jgi:hypothetical protein
LGVADYEQLLGSMPAVLLHALWSRAGFGNILPGLDDVEKFTESQRRIEKRAELRKLLTDLEEPNPEQLKFILSRLKSLPSIFKRTLTETAGQIRPRGGPHEKLSDPEQIRTVTDEIFDAVAKAKEVGLKTVQRRFREEKKRRASMCASEH